MVGKLAHGYPDRLAERGGAEPAARAGQGGHRSCEAMACTADAAQPVAVGCGGPQPVAMTVTAAAIPHATSGTGHHFTLGYGRVRTSCPSLVTSTVCSNCALRLWSRVTAVQPSGHMS